MSVVVILVVSPVFALLPLSLNPTTTTWTFRLLASFLTPGPMMTAAASSVHSAALVEIKADGEKSNYNDGSGDQNADEDCAIIVSAIYHVGAASALAEGTVFEAIHGYWKYWHRIVFGERRLVV